ncbi:MAG: dTMP kinase [Thermoplasmata archaeon]|nr:dTMP kinase [Thermoplasmata archaeon]
MARFLVFEGIDGSGKSSICRALYKKMKREDIVLTMEPTKTWLGDAVKKSHHENVNPFTEAFLFMADRAAHSDKIKSWLEKGKTVLSDRYYHSTVAYQAAALEGQTDFDVFSWLLSINRKICVEPESVYYFKIEPKIALSRLKNRSGLSKFENVEFLRKVSEYYDRLAEISENIVTIDAKRPQSSLVDELARMF